MYNTSRHFNEVVPSGEQIWFGCEQGFYPRDPMVTTCQEDGLWYPDPSEVDCHSEKFVPCSFNFANVDKMPLFSMIPDYAYNFQRSA